MAGDGLVVGLTGATGHIGGRLLERLVGHPNVAEVRTVARRPLAPAAGLAARGQGFVHVQADLASPAAREALNGSDIVYHLAAQVWGGRGPQAPADMHRTNVIGTGNVLGARVGAVVLASSVTVYGAWPDNPQPLDESCPP